jgi:hypothetical protein
MNTEEEKIKDWWAEFERELAKQVKPNDPNPPLKPIMPQPKIPTQIVFKRGGTSYYTLHDDYQFPVKSNHPDAQGWENV